MKTITFDETKGVLPALEAFKEKHLIPPTQERGWSWAEMQRVAFIAGWNAHRLSASPSPEPQDERGVGRATDASAGAADCVCPCTCLTPCSRDCHCADPFKNGACSKCDGSGVIYTHAPPAQPQESRLADAVRSAIGELDAAGDIPQWLELLGERLRSALAVGPQERAEGRTVVVPAQTREKVREISAWALFGPNGYVPGTLNESRVGCWEQGFWSVSAEIDGFQQKYWKRWQLSINAARKAGYVMRRVVMRAGD